MILVQRYTIQHTHSIKSLDYHIIMLCNHGTTVQAYAYQNDIITSTLWWHAGMSLTNASSACRPPNHRPTHPPTHLHTHTHPLPHPPTDRTAVNGTANAHQNELTALSCCAIMPLRYDRTAIATSYPLATFGHTLNKHQKCVLTPHHPPIHPSTLNVFMLYDNVTVLRIALLLIALLH